MKKKAKILTGILQNILLLNILFSLVLFSGCTSKQNDKRQSDVEDFVDQSFMNKYAIVLYGTKAEKKERVQEISGRVFQMDGVGNFTWKASIPESGDYEVVISYASGREGSQIKIATQNDTITDVVHKTEGYYYDSSLMWQQNFERVTVKGILKLIEGENTISFGLADPYPKTVLYFRCLELYPVSKKEAINTEVEKAVGERASTDWLAKAGYGLMFHWTSQSQPKEGSLKPYAQAVDDFNVDAFVDMVVKTGARYVLFTNGHAESYCPAPIMAWEKIHPGMTTKRDLLMELSEKLNERGVKFMIYMNSPLMALMGKVTAEEYMENHRKILTEIGERYGSKIAGYAFDSWYQGYEEYPDFSFEELFRLCKIGYANRLVAFNTWILPVNTPWQDFWFGETYIPGNPANKRLIQRGPGHGLQYNSLIVLENQWVHDRAGTMAEPWLNAQELSDYIKACMMKNGTVTINIGIYQEGTIGEKSLSLMEELRDLVRLKDDN